MARLSVRCRLLLLVLAILFTGGGEAESADLEITLAAPDDNAAPWVHLLASVFETQVTASLDGSSTPVRWHRLAIGAGDEPGAPFNLVKSGEAQIALVSVSSHPWSLYPLGISYATPFSCGEPSDMAAAIDNLNASFPALDLAWASLDLIYLGGGYAHAPYLLATQFPIERFEDLQGHRLSTPELALDWLHGTGANALAGDGETFLVGLATNKIDGVVTHAAQIERLRLDGHAPYLTDIGLGAVYEGGLVANRDWFDAQRPSVQIAVRDAAIAYGRAVSSLQADHGADAIAAMVERGAKFLNLNDAERHFWVQQLPDLAGDWAYELDVRDMPGSQMLAAYAAGLAETCGESLRAWYPTEP